MEKQKKAANGYLSKIGTNFAPVFHWFKPVPENLFISMEGKHRAVFFANALVFPFQQTTKQMSVFLCGCLQVHYPF